MGLLKVFLEQDSRSFSTSLQTLMNHFLEAFRFENLFYINDRYVAYVLECLMRDSFSPLLYSLPLDQRTNRAERFLSPGQRRTHSPGKNCAQGALSLSEDGVHDAPA